MIRPATEVVDEASKHKSNSRDVSRIVADAEVFLELHGLVGGTELNVRSETQYCCCSIRQQRRPMKCFIPK